MSAPVQDGVGRDGASVGGLLHAIEKGEWGFRWTCDKWSEEACSFVRKKLHLEKFAPVSSDQLLAVIGRPEEILVVEGNLLLNEGIQRLEDLLIAAGGTSYNNANAFIGVGTSSTAAAATQTELQGSQDSSNRFYKAMVASYPQRTSQTVDWRSDFTSTEANFAWAEWTISAGATTASGSGFLVGTTNLNRKVESLGTKATGTWTMTGSVTIS